MKSTCTGRHALLRDFPSRDVLRSVARAVDEIVGIVRGLVGRLLLVVVDRFVGLNLTEETHAEDVCVEGEERGRGKGDGEMEG